MAQPKLTEEEKIQLARESREFFLQGRQYANDRENQISDGIRTVELQVAAIIFALTGAFALGTEIVEGTFWIPILTSIGLVFLALSIVFGLINEWVRSRFWKGVANLKEEAFLEYDRVLLKEKTFENAREYVKGLIGGEKKRMQSPSWPVVLQTILLAIGGLSVLIAKILLPSGIT